MISSWYIKTSPAWITHGKATSHGISRPHWIFCERSWIDEVPTSNKPSGFNYDSAKLPNDVLDGRTLRWLSPELNARFDNVWVKMRCLSVIGKSTCLMDNRLANTQSTVQVWALCTAYLACELTPPIEPDAKSAHTGISSPYFLAKVRFENSNPIIEMWEKFAYDANFKALPV